MYILEQRNRGLLLFIWQTIVPKMLLKYMSSYIINKDSYDIIYLVE